MPQRYPRWGTNVEETTAVGVEQLIPREDHIKEVDTGRT